MLAHPQLPPGLINHCLDVMLVIMDSERDLIRIVVEIVIDLRDEDAGMEENPNSTVCLPVTGRLSQFELTEWYR